jgi:hypothetical protein
MTRPLIGTERQAAAVKFRSAVSSSSSGWLPGRKSRTMARLRPPHVPDRPAPGFATGDLTRLECQRRPVAPAVPRHRRDPLLLDVRQVIPLPDRYGHPGFEISPRRRQAGRNGTKGGIRPHLPEGAASSRQSSLKSGTKRRVTAPLGWRLLRNPIWQTLCANRAAPTFSLLASVGPGWVCGSVPMGGLATYADDAGCANALQLRGLQKGREVESGAGEEAVKGDHERRLLDRSP